MIKNSLFTTSIMPICLKVKNASKTVSMNPHTTLRKRCIPIMIKYVKETKELTKSEINSVRNQIQKIGLPTFTTTNGVYIVTTEIKLIMVYGKVCTALSDIPSSSTCNICKATPSKMNDLERVKQKTEIVSNFEIGLSTLHAWIRFMEWGLHITI